MIEGARQRRAIAMVGFEAAGLVVLALALNLAGNGRTGLWDRDEPRYAGAVREMRARGDWIAPWFNGEPRYHKPILIYWLMGVATAVGGDNPFAARLVSVFAGVGVVLLTWWLGRRLFGPAAGRLAGLVTACTPALVAQSKLATTDATLVLETLACLVCLWELSARPSRRVAMAFWVVLALATLTKGPVAAALISTVVLAGWAFGWRPPGPSRLEWSRGLLVFSAVTAPWFLVITAVSRGEFLRFAVGDQLLGHVTSEMERHGGFPGFYAVGSLLAFQPWSALVPAALAAAWGRRRSSPEMGFLLGWVVGPMLLLECFRTKLLHYYLPALPAWAILTAWLVGTLEIDIANLRRHRFGRLGIGLLLGFGLSLAVALFAAAVVIPGPTRAPLFLVAGFILVGTLAASTLLERGRPTRAIQMLCGGWACALLATGGWLFPAIEPFRASRLVGERLKTLAAETGLEPVLLDYQPPGIIYAYGAPVATAHNKASFFSHLESASSVLTVVDPAEIPRLERKYDLVMRPLGRVEGLPMTLFKRETVELVQVSRSAVAVGGEAVRR